MVNIRKELKKGKKAYEETQRELRKKIKEKKIKEEKEEIKQNKRYEEESKNPLNRIMGGIIIIAVIIFMMWTKTGIGHLINFDMFR